MNINYDLEFDLDSFLSDLEKRQSNRKRVRLEDRKRQAKRLRNSLKGDGEKAK